MNGFVFLTLSFFAITASFPAMAQGREPVLTAPDHYMESAPPGMLECGQDMTSLVSHAEFRKFALRNEVWPQENDFVFLPEDWTTMRVVSKPERASAPKYRRLRAKVYVLIGGNGQVLDKIVTCASRPELRVELIKLVDSYRFEPTSYKGRGLNSIMTLNFGP